MLTRPDTPFDEDGWGDMLADIRRHDLIISGGGNDTNNNSPKDVSNAVADDGFAGSGASAINLTTEVTQAITNAVNNTTSNITNVNSALMSIDISGVYTVGVCLSCVAGTWALATASSTGLMGIVVYTDGLAFSTIVVFGMIDWDGTPGTIYYPQASGGVTNSVTGHQPWPIMAQILTGQALVNGVTPRFAPVSTNYCDSGTVMTGTALWEP